MALLALPRARRCGGKQVRVAQVKADVVESDERHLRLRVSLPLPTFTAHQVGGSEYQQMLMEGAGETGDRGKPGLPIIGQFFGVPEGADVTVTVNGTTASTCPASTSSRTSPIPWTRAPPASPRYPTSSRTRS